VENKLPWWVGTVLALAVPAFAYFVWPTPWKLARVAHRYELQQHRLDEREFRVRKWDRLGWSKWVRHTERALYTYRPEPAPPGGG
jgi:hypothetical protein